MTTFKPVAVRRSHNIGPPFGHMTAFVAMLQRADKSRMLVSGMPHDTKESAFREAETEAARLNAMTA